MSKFLKPRTFFLIDEQFLKPENIFKIWDLFVSHFFNLTEIILNYYLFFKIFCSDLTPSGENLDIFSRAVTSEIDLTKDPIRSNKRNLGHVG